MKVRTLLPAFWCAKLIFVPGIAAQSADDSTAFLLTSDDPHRAPSPFIGNGRIGLVIPALGISPSISLMAGLYEHADSDVPRIVALPAWNGIGVYDGSRWVGPETPDGSVRAYRQVLDMRTGVAHTSYQWVNGRKTMVVRVEHFISRAQPGIGGIRLDLAPHYAARLKVRFALAGLEPPQRLALGTVEKADPAWKPNDIWYPGQMNVRSRAVVRTPSGALLTLSSSPEGRPSRLKQVARVIWGRSLSHVTVRPLASGDSAMIEVSFDAVPGETYSFSETVSFLTSSVLKQAPGPRQTVSNKSYAALAEESAQAWRRRWQTDIQIEGDPSLQKLVRSMEFYLLASTDSTTGLGIPPMGLSSAGYYGHIFWDSDTWMFPALLLTHPDVAHSLVSFRFRTLSAAQANARKNGFQGAMYPWEADEQGNETTPHFAAQNASSEIHVNGDVALAQWQYYLATGDSSWLAREGYPVIRETADFWASRASYDSADEQYHIRNVVSVSEGLVGVSDDAYTNAVAKKNLEIAVLASRKVGEKPAAQWGEIAAGLHLPYDSVTEVYRTYEGAPDSTLGEVTPLLAYPLGVPMSDRAKRSNLEPAARGLMTKNEGALMGAALLAVNASELGDRSLVDSLLPHSYQDWLQGPFLMLSETPTNKAVNFLTGAGAFLQQVLYGYTGLRIRGNGIEPAFPAMLPSRLIRLTLKNVSIRGKRYDIMVDSTGRRIIPRRKGSR